MPRSIASMSSFVHRERLIYVSSFILQWLKIKLQIRDLEQLA